MGRPCSVESHQAILEAALELMAVEGIQGTSMEAIAAHAGVGKTTIYRRWPTKEALIADALGELHIHIHFVDTGHFRADLVASLSEIQHHLETHPLLKGLFLRVFGEMQAWPELMQIFYERVFSVRVGHVMNFFTQAQACGSAPRSASFLYRQPHAGSTAPQPVSRRGVAQLLLTEHLPERIVDAVLQGIGVQPEQK